MLAIVEILGLLASAIIAWNALLTPAGKAKVGNIITNFYTGAISVAAPVLAAFVGLLGPTVEAWIAAFQEYGGAIATSVETPVAAVARAAYTTADANLAAGGESTASNATQQAADAFALAFGFGISSAVVTAAFEAAFPEKLNTLNGAGPMLAQMAGFSEVAAQVLGPLYKNAFGRSLEYKYAAQFTPNLPTPREAAEWLARGIITADQFPAIYGAGGLKSEYSADVTEAAFRPVSPFILARAAETGALSDTDLIDVLTFGGYRAVDQTRLIAAFNAAALTPYLAGLVSAIVTAAERGTISITDLPTDLQNAGVIAPAIPLIVQTVSYRRLEQLAELYRKSISEGYQYGTISDADYVTDLEAIGIGAADAEAHYAIDSIKKNGKTAAAALRAAASLEVKQQRAATQAAIAQYRNGTYDEAELTAALLAIGIDPGIAGYSVTIQSAKRAGNVVYVYGLSLPRDQAVALRENVAALAKQVTAGLVGYTAAASTLAGFGIPTENANALLATWTATKTPAADVGTKEPL